MSQPLDTGVLMAARFGLADGPPVRLRLARPSDRAGVTQLLQRRGIAPDELEVERLLRHDPRERTVLCALTWTGRQELVTGIGAIDFGALEPAALVADERVAPGVGELLWHALLDRSGRTARRRA